MTPEDQKVIDMQFNAIMKEMKDMAEKQKLRDENILMRLTSTNAQLEAQMDLITMTADNDRAILIETRDNTRLTNGRVTKLERERNDHIISCPRVKEIDEIKTSIQDLTFVQRHPVLFVVLCIAVVIVAFYFKTLP